MLDNTNRTLLTEWLVANNDENIIAELAKAKNPVTSCCGTACSSPGGIHAPWRFCNYSQHCQHFDLVMIDVHKHCEDCSDTSNVDKVAEQAMVAKDALGFAKHAGNNSSSSNSVEVRHNISSTEVLKESQQQDSIGQ
jgi:hypothetical protein